MKSIYKTILLNREISHKMLAVLLDPDQCRGSILASTVATLKTNTPDFIFVGGSHTVNSIDSLIDLLKEEIKTNIVLFPGNALQFSSNADALLYLSLVSGRNADFLIGQHISSAVAIKKSKVEVIPTGYLLVDGGKPTSVEYISNTRPIPRDKKEIALSTAVAAELLGMKLIYLEAGSGANTPVPIEMIEYVKAGLSLPLIVGGGIKSTDELKDAFDAGADMVVVGNIFETFPTKIAEFVAFTRGYSVEKLTNQPN
ncbi:MAG: geranylgeranylglyceryl/heptaprenylglyceryl phosphate synthase [Bacteroidota bacterium]|nr:geranylgeranylglyceryl/heptaprenylglyceryl phosphate synthase [Bacteroidota bacterium]